MEKVQKIMKSLYHEGLIDDTFSYDYTQEQGFGFAMIGGDTNNPDTLSRSFEKHVIDQQNKETFLLRRA